MDPSLKQLTERVWIYPYEEERDRPNLGYIRGDKLCLAVDAGHSDDHIAGFYRSLLEAGLPLPDITILTHWHWDHTFAMHKAHGLTLANACTNRHLLRFRERVQREGVGFFLAMDGSIRREYAQDRPVVITPADVVFSGEVLIDLGGCTVRAFQTQSPHTDDATLASIPGEGVLFLGDACWGVFPTWERDASLAATLASTLSTLDADIIVTGHTDPSGRQAIIDDLMENRE